MDLLTVIVTTGVLATAPVDTLKPSTELPTVSGPVLLERFTADAQAPQQPAFRYDAAYYRRLDIHRYASYTMLPLFALQYYAGSKLYEGEGDDWAKTAHPIVAGAIGALFVTNTTIGVWNLWVGRKDPNDRKRKIFHASMMLLADAGFVTTGILAQRADEGDSGKSNHRAAALTSMGVATVGWLSMLEIFRED